MVVCGLVNKYYSLKKHASSLLNYKTELTQRLVCFYNNLTKENNRI